MEALDRGVWYRSGVTKAEAKILKLAQFPGLDALSMGRLPSGATTLLPEKFHCMV